MTSALSKARQVRLEEKQRYFAANNFPDMEEWWKAYEKLIYNRYTHLIDCSHLYNNFHWEQALDAAWIKRGWQHSITVNKRNDQDNIVVDAQ